MNANMVQFTSILQVARQCLAQLHKVIFKLLIILSFFLPIQILKAGWLDRKAEGWFWYEDRVKKKNEEELACPDFQAPQSPAQSIPLTATEEMSLIRKELEERLNQAILEPTDANVMAYMQMQQQWVHQSSQFSQTWVKNLLDHPQLDSRLIAPITQYGVQVQKQISREQKEERIRSLTESHGLAFFYEGNNKISQAFSFVVKEFAKKYKWQVIAISCDGVLIPGFENNQVNQGLVQRLSVEYFPSIYLIEPSRDVVLPIAYGLSSIDQIEENIDIQLQSNLRGQ
jgi:conjugal transfer pilus assembly protein TraF